MAREDVAPRWRRAAVNSDDRAPERRSAYPEHRGVSAAMVGSLARAIALLDAVAESDGGARVGELARRIGANPNTASRLLGTLEAGGPVEREPGARYRLGLKLVSRNPDYFRVS